MPKSRARFVTLNALLVRRRLDADEQTIKAGRVLVDDRVVLNPAARVPATAAVRVLAEARLRGDVKLSYALDHFELRIGGRVVADVGASSGGFTSALLDRGATRVYAIDAGVGQLKGWLRADARVVNLEGHNLGAITSANVPEPVGLITVDLSYLAVADAVPQLERLAIAPDADLVTLVKPTFELRRAAPPSTEREFVEAVSKAATAINRGAWRVVDTCESGVSGRGGTTEFFIRARRAARLS